MQQSSPLAEDRSADDTVAALRRAATHIRRTSLQMVHRAGLGHPGGDLSAADILAVLYFDVLRLDPATLAPARSRPLHPQQGTLLCRALRRRSRSPAFSGRAAGDVHAAALAAQRAPRSQQGARRRSQHRAARPRPADRRRHRARRTHGSRPVAHLRADRRRGAAGRQQLGGRHVCGAVSARQPDRHRRSQRAAAGRHDRAHGRPRTARANAGEPSDGASARWTATTSRRCARCFGARARGTEAADAA